MIKLKELFDAQRELQELMGHPLGKGLTGFHNAIFAMHVELVEVLNELNWKPWKAEKKVVDREALATEMADVLQFWVNAFITLDLDELSLTSVIVGPSHDLSCFEKYYDIMPGRPITSLKRMLTNTLNLCTLDDNQHLPGYEQALKSRLVRLGFGWARLTGDLGLSMQELSDALEKKWKINHQRLANLEVTRCQRSS